MPRVSRARRAKEKRRAKRWYRVLTSKELGDIELDSALASSPESLVGKVVRSSGQQLSGDFTKSHLRLFFKIEKVEGEDAIAMFTGHEAGSDYLRGLVRRRRSKIDCIVNVKIKNGYGIKVHAVVISRSRLNRSHRKGIRDSAVSYMDEFIGNLTLGEFFQDVLSGRIVREIQSRCKKIAPISGAELVRSCVEKMPSEGELEKEEIKEVETGEEIKGTVEIGEEKLTDA